MKTLLDYLQTQDMGEKYVARICEEVLNDTFDANEDLITGIIVKAYKDNLYGKIPDSSDLDAFETDLNYAINQLQKVKKEIYTPEEY
jgi:hypothetical protein